MLLSRLQAAPLHFFPGPLMYLFKNESVGDAFPSILSHLMLGSQIAGLLLALPAWMRWSIAAPVDPGFATAIHPNKISAPPALQLLLFAFRCSIVVDQLSHLERAFQSIFDQLTTDGTSQLPWAVRCRTDDMWSTWSSIANAYVAQSIPDQQSSNQVLEGLLRTSLREPAAFIYRFILGEVRGDHGLVTPDSAQMSCLWTDHHSSTAWEKVRRVVFQTPIDESIRSHGLVSPVLAWSSNLLLSSVWTKSANSYKLVQKGGFAAPVDLADSVTPEFRFLVLNEVEPRFGKRFIGTGVPSLPSVDVIQPAHLVKCDDDGVVDDPFHKLACETLSSSDKVELHAFARSLNRFIFHRVISDGPRPLLLAFNGTNHYCSVLPSIFSSTELCAPPLGTRGLSQFVPPCSPCLVAGVSNLELATSALGQLFLQAQADATCLPFPPSTFPDTSSAAISLQSLLTHLHTVQRPPPVCGDWTTSDTSLAPAFLFALASSIAHTAPWLEGSAFGALLPMLHTRSGLRDALSPNRSIGSVESCISWPLALPNRLALGTSKFAGGQDSAINGLGVLAVQFVDTLITYDIKRWTSCEYQDLLQRVSKDMEEMHTQPLGVWSYNWNRWIAARANLWGLSQTGTTTPLSLAAATRSCAELAKTLLFTASQLFAGQPCCLTSALALMHKAQIVVDNSRVPHAKAVEFQLALVRCDSTPSTSSPNYTAQNHRGWVSVLDASQTPHIPTRQVSIITLFVEHHIMSGQCFSPCAVLQHGKQSSWPQSFGLLSTTPYAGLPIIPYAGPPIPSHVLLLKSF